MRPALLALLVAAALAPSLAIAADESPKPKTTQELLDASQPSDWRTLDPANTLYLELASGRVVIELAPDFAPAHVGNVRTLAQEGYWNGMSINRSQDNFVVQWGDPAGEGQPRKSLGSERTFDRDISSGTALREALEAKHIVGAALDVFPTEPKKQGDAFESELRGLPNVILTPHIGGSTEEAQMSIGEFVAGKFRDYLLTGTTTLSANLPMLAPQDVGTNHRMAFLHLNTPGVLAAVNQTFANYGVNIEGQQLATRGETGYVVTDVSTPIAPELVAELRGMDSSIRLRILN